MNKRRPLVQTALIYTKKELMHLSIEVDDMIREDILTRVGQGEFVEIQMWDANMPWNSNGYTANLTHKFSNGLQMFLIPVEELPVHINDPDLYARAIAKWRLSLGK